MRKASNGMSRVERVALLVKEELARLINEGLKDPRVGMVTVTDVVLTSDLREGVVYVSVYGNEETQKNTLKGLEAASSYLRHEISTVLTIRHIPVLTFKIDDSLERGLRMDRLLHQIATGQEVDLPEEDNNEPIEYVTVQTLHDTTPIEAMPKPVKKKSNPRRPSTRPPRGGNSLHKRSTSRR